MPADNVEFSGDRRFRLFYWEEDKAGHTQKSIRLEHAPTGVVVLDLTDDACDVESWRFGGGGTLLHLVLSRAARDIVRYPATIDLRTGLYYHHPDPRQAHAPAGRAEDLETLMCTGKAPQYDPAAPVRWPHHDSLDWPEVPGVRVRNAPEPAAVEPHTPAVPIVGPTHHVSSPALAGGAPGTAGAGAAAPAARSSETGAMRPKRASTPTPTAPSRHLLSKDGAWRVELAETGRTDRVGDGSTRPYYRAIFVRTADGAVIADCGAFRLDAWVMGHEDREIQLRSGPGSSTWISVDLDRSEFWLENFREPLSQTYPLGSLGAQLREGLA